MGASNPVCAHTVRKHRRPGPFDFGETNPPPPEVAAPVSGGDLTTRAGMTRTNSLFGLNNCLFGRNNSVFVSSREFGGTCWKCCAN